MLRLTIKDGRHPVLDQILWKKSLCRTTRRSRGENGGWPVITGLEHGGKSTYIRQVALIVLMAQIGSSFRRKAEIGLVDRIFTMSARMTILRAAVHFHGRDE